jgi:hypothetical protein
MDANDDGLVGWEQFARTVQANLDFLFALPSLRTLEVGGIQNFPSSILLTFMRIHHLLIDAHFTVDAGLAAGSATSLKVLSSIKLKSLTLREVGKELISALTSMLAYNPTTLKRLDLAPVKVVGVDEFSSSVWGLIRLGGRALEEFEWESVSSRRTYHCTFTCRSDSLTVNFLPICSSSQRVQAHRPRLYSSNTEAPHRIHHL